MRVLVEDFIMMKYLSKNEALHDNIWRDYQLYGMGLYKLVLGFKMSVAFIVYKLCDKKRINTTDLNSFLTKSQEYSFSDKLFNTLSARGINENNFTNYPIRQLVVEELEKYYDWMETM